MTGTLPVPVQTDSQAVSRPVAPTRRPAGCRLTEWKPVDGNPALVGRCTVCFQGGWIVSAIPIFRRADNTLSAGTPSSPVLDPNGVQLRDENGKRRYSAIITFETKEARSRWNDAILAALSEGGVA